MSNAGEVNTSHVVILAVVGVVSAALWVGALVSVLRTAVLPRVAVWVAATFLFPVVGPVVWFLVGRSRESTVSAARWGKHREPLEH